MSSTSPLSALRHWLEACHLDGMIVPRADAWQSEYCAPCDEKLVWLTGFDGSAGVALVLKDKALLFVDGREDEMIVSGGENVYPAEVEDLLTGHPLVAEAAVTGVPDPEFGHRLVAYVVRRPGRRVRADTLRAYVRDHLARYKVPRDIVFVDELPRTTTGKVRKRDLP